MYDTTKRGRIGLDEHPIPIPTKNQSDRDGQQPTGGHRGHYISKPAASRVSTAVAFSRTPVRDG